MFYILRWAPRTRHRMLRSQLCCSRTLSRAYQSSLWSNTSLRNHLQKPQKVKACRRRRQMRNICGCSSTALTAPYCRRSFLLHQSLLALAARRPTAYLWRMLRAVRKAAALKLVSTGRSAYYYVPSYLRRYVYFKSFVYHMRTKVNKVITNEGISRSAR